MAYIRYTTYERNYLAKFVYNHIDNLRGSLLRIMFITKGSKVSHLKQ